MSGVRGKGKTGEPIVKPAKPTEIDITPAQKKMVQEAADRRRNPVGRLMDQDPQRDRSHDAVRIVPPDDAKKGIHLPDGLHQERDEKNNIGMVEFEGKRFGHEDRHACGAIKKADGLGDGEWLHILRGNVAALEDGLKSAKNVPYKVEGCCLISNIVVGKKIYTASLGDSTAFLVILDAQGQPTIKRLNKTLHNVSSKDEIERVKKINNHAIQGGRLCGDIAITRSLGDDRYEPFGLSHEPELSVDEVDIPEGGSAFLITACDGMTEQMTEAAIAQYIATNKDKKPDEIAAGLLEEAYNAGSGDNISIMVTPIDPKSKTPKYACVFDGHGGRKVADFAADNFAPKLQEGLEQHRQHLIRMVMHLTAVCEIYIEHLSSVKESKNDKILKYKKAAMTRLLGQFDKTPSQSSISELKQMLVKFKNTFEQPDADKSLPAVKDVIKKDRSDPARQFFKKVAYYLTLTLVKSLKPTGERAKHKIKKKFAKVERQYAGFFTTPTPKVKSEKASTHTTHSTKKKTH